MNKFKTGDKAMFKSFDHEIKRYSKYTPLDLYAPAKVVATEYENSVDYIYLEGDKEAWPSSLWEPFEEWAEHQKSTPELVYTDCNGDTKSLDQFHLHELVDRIHCVRVMLEYLLQSHPAGHLVAEELEAVQEKLGEAYQKAGEISFDKFKE